MKPTNSETTTSPGIAGSRTGTGLGSHGSATPEGLLREWLQARSPAEVDKAAVSKALSLNVSLQVGSNLVGRYDANGNRTHNEARVTGCSVMGEAADRAAALASISKLELAAEPQSIAAWLTELMMICARRQDDNFVEALRIKAYADRLATFPADVAKAAVLGKTWKFWPTWAELEEECDRLSAPRRAMVSALRLPYRDPAAKDTRPADAPDPDMVEKIMTDAGFTAKRMSAVRAMPMATTYAEAESKADTPRKPHWSEGAGPDDPRWDMVRKSRAASAVLPMGDA